jgi:hypothetical protein
MWNRQFFYSSIVAWAGLFVNPVMGLSSLSKITNNTTAVHQGIRSNTWLWNLFEVHSPWYQTVTDNYVKYSSEIDWYCTSHIINVTSPTSLTIDTRTRIHNDLLVHQHMNWHSCKTHPQTGSMVCLATTTTDNEKEKKTNETEYTIKDVWSTENDKAAAIVITKNDNLTMYVWTTDTQVFFDQIEPFVYKQLDEWNYTGNHKAPVVVYDNDVC